MKNLLALAVSAAILSPLAAHAANTPDNVGDVTYIGNIVANSSMWQWTVNDYPTRLDVKPSAATTANGATTYPLTASPFIAVSGFLPSAAPLLGTQVNPEFDPADGGSCFAGTGRVHEPAEVVYGSASAPTPGVQSATAFAGFIAALADADENGSAPRFASFRFWADWAVAALMPCDTPTTAVYMYPGVYSEYFAAAHVLELTPTKLAFTTPVQGSWSSTLTVTAYQM